MNHLLRFAGNIIYSIDIMDNANLNSLIGRVSRTAALLLTGLLGTGAAAAQSLNWDGQTGVFITPLAYTAASPASGFGLPIVAYHFLNAGSVLGNFHTISITEGVGGRVEFGYTRDEHQEGSTAGLSPLWGSGFNIVHAKVNVVKENAGKQSWLPAISAGFVARTEDRNVSGLLAAPNKSYSNADFYAVASKTITQTKPVPIVLNLGYKATNASVYGLAGHYSGYIGSFRRGSRRDHHQRGSHRDGPAAGARRRHPERYFERGRGGGGGTAGQATGV
jgi:hypothetical protein